ncbi:hypothetical protein EI94DRAFT_679489 [Lactarius quietus]|nr:hypothetical protein EI94DRAFT_679489 [Lactarius quietus]
MLSSVGHLALHRWIQSVGHSLKFFILRCLLFWPRVLRSIRPIWSLSGTDLKDVPKKRGGQARPSFPGASGACEGYSTVHTSRDPNRSRLPLGSGSEEFFQLAQFAGPSQSEPRSPASSLGPSLPGSPHHSESHLPGGSTSSIQLPHIHHLNSPLTLTHSRATSMQFAGARRRSRSQSRSRSPSLSRFPHSHSLPPSSISESPAASPGPSRPPTRPPSPITFPEPHLMPQPSVLESSGSIQFRNVAPISHDTSEENPGPSIKISPPSRSQGVDSQFVMNFPESPLSIRENSEEDFLRFPNRPHSMLYNSQVTLVDLPTVDESGNWSDNKKRSIGLMHSDQVSRYVNKGDVPREGSKFRLGPMEVNLPKYSFGKRPKGWEPATHPGGAVYFYHAEWKILTDVNMYDPELNREVQAFAMSKIRRMKSSGLTTMSTMIPKHYFGRTVMSAETVFWARYVA